MINEVWLDVTSKCSGPSRTGQCSYCARKKDYSTSTGPTLTPAEIRSAFSTENILPFDSSRINISGGEPSECYNLAEKIDAMGSQRKISIFTNGSDIERLISLENESIDNITYSIHTDNFETFDVGGILELCSRTDKSIHVTAVLTKKNMDTAYSLIQKLPTFKPFSRSLYSSKDPRLLRFFSVIPFKHVPEALVLHEADRESIHEEVLSHTINGPSFNRYFMYMYSGSIFALCDWKLPVRHDGAIMFCMGLYGPSFGNIKNNAKEAIVRRYDFICMLSERKEEILPLVKQENNPIKVNCAVHLERLFTDHEDIWRPLFEKACRGVV